MSQNWMQQNNQGINAVIHTSFSIDYLEKNKKKKKK
jgi:hypothetical protein